MQHLIDIALRLDVITALIATMILPIHKRWGWKLLKYALGGMFTLVGLSMFFTWLQVSTTQFVVQHQGLINAIKLILLALIVTWVILVVRTRRPPKPTLTGRLEAEAGAIAESDNWKYLVAILYGDTRQAERLVSYEQNLDPGNSRAAHIAAAIQKLHWDRSR